jgi:single-strand selective monofunctional uracil DNA glycosylase
LELDAFLDRTRAQAEDADRLRRSLRLAPGDRVLNVHDYGLPSYEAFLRKFYADGAPRIVALSMNPGPFGAVQTGIPFCDTGMARTFLPDFDALVARKPRWAAAERTEISARHLVRWSAAQFGGITHLYGRMLLAMTCPLAILRGERRTNVPLPALPRSEQEKIEAFIARHAPDEIRLARPPGVFILGQWAERVWHIVKKGGPQPGTVARGGRPTPGGAPLQPGEGQGVDGCVPGPSKADSKYLKMGPQA